MRKEKPSESYIKNGLNYGGISDISPRPKTTVG